jgi:predicted metal-dependent peptidase
MNRLPNKLELTDAQERQMTEARVAFMRACAFFGYYYWDKMVEWPTDEVATAATDGKRIMFNPAYLGTLKPQERCFVLAHEVYHTILRHPQRMATYRKTGKVRGLPYDAELFNIAADYVINDMLVKNHIGLCNPSWLHDPQYTEQMSVEDVYEKLYKKLPPPPGGGGEAERGDKPKTRGETHRGGKPDPHADQGRFDTVHEPYQDPATGREDAPGETEFREAIAKAVAAAKAVGTLPGSLQRTVDEIMEPQINWKEHIRMELTGKLGARRETWDRPNRRRLVLNPIIYLPGKKGYGVELVCVAIDSSGSIGEAEYSAFFAETAAVLSDCRPREVMMIWCDARVQRVERARSLDELEAIRVSPTPGGGGTSFIPPFEYLAEQDVRPDTLVYLTDMMGPFPQAKPNYPVIWCKTTDYPAPWGEEVRITI